MFHDGEALSIVTNNASTGSQCLQIDAALLEQVGPNSSRAFAFSRALENSASPAPIVEIHAQVRLDGPRTGSKGTPDQDLASANLFATVSFTASSAATLGGFIVSSAGRIWTYGGVAEEAYKFSTDYTLGTYRELTLRVDFVARQLTYIVDGIILGSSPFASSVTADRLYSGYLELAAPIDPINTPELTYDRANYRAYFDDYSLESVPVGPVNAVIEFASTNALSDEFLATAEVTLVRRGFTKAAVRVSISSTNETAKAGEDYEAISSFVTFAVGETNKTIAVPLHDDYWAEPDKSFLVRISGLPPGATSPRSSTRVIIRDDDRPGGIDYSWVSNLAGPTLKPGEFLYPDPIYKLPNGQLLVNVAVIDATETAAYYYLVRLNSDGTVDRKYPDSAPRSQTGKTYLRTTVMGSDYTCYVLDHEDVRPGQIEIRLTDIIRPDGSNGGSIPALLGSFDYNLIPQTDGKLVVSGSPGFGSSAALTLDGERMPPFFRINPDGSRDVSFVGPTHLLGNLRLLTDGRIYLESNVAQPYRLYRLNTDGSLDSTFAAPSNVDLAVKKVLSNGDLVADSVASQQWQFSKLYRLRPNGSLISGYTVGTATGQPSMILSVIEQPDGKLVVSGGFRQFNGTVQNSIVRIKTDGTVDSTFRSGKGFTEGSPGAPGPVYLSARADGSLMISGLFDKYNGEKATAPILLNPDGTWNREAQNEGTWFDALGSVAPRPALFLKGDYLGSPSFGSDTHGFYITGEGLARIRTDLSLRIISHTHEANAISHLLANALPDRSYTLQASENLSDWLDLTTQLATTNRIEFIDTPSPSVARRLYRVKQN